MPFLIDAEYLPAILTSQPMTDEEFAELCSDHPDLFFEMSAEGELIVMPPNYSLTGMRHGKILNQLENWAEQDGRGGVTDAASGFRLPNGARRSPDAAWTLNSRIEQLSSNSFERYWHLCPDFVIEVRSKTDRLRNLREKMAEWIANGAQLAWMIDPGNRTVEIYRPNAAAAELLNNPESLQGEGPVEGFVLNLNRVWNPMNR